MTHYNWQDIKDDYIKSTLTLKEICDKHGIKITLLNSKINKEGWRELKEISDEELENRTRRILNLSDRILDKVEKAIEEVSTHIIRTKEKTKDVSYDEETKKPLNECIRETEKEEVVECLVDTGSLKQLVATLKDVRDIQLGFSQDTSKTNDENESGVIMISDAPIHQNEGEAV